MTTTTTRPSQSKSTGMEFKVRDLSLAEYASLFPVAMFSNVMPLTPGGGVGVGETVLGQLFRWSASAQADPEVLSQAGVSLMIWFRFIFFSMAGVGGLLYAFYKRDGAIGVQRP